MYLECCDFKEEDSGPLSEVGKVADQEEKTWEKQTSEGWVQSLEIGFHRYRETPRNQEWRLKEDWGGVPEGLSSGPPECT